MFFTNHFHERLFERRGIVLSKEEQHAIISQIKADILDNPPDTRVIEYDCKVNGNRFVICLDIVNQTLMTAYIQRRTGRKKFKKKIVPQLYD